MEDEKIVALYEERSEEAIAASSQKYGRYCHTIAYNVLYSEEDAEECVSDTWLRAWGAIPPARPESLKAFLGKITRNLALDRYDAAKAKKRGGGETETAIDELSEILPDESPQSQALEELELTEILNDFLKTLSPEKRKIFMRRYWYMDSVKEISQMYGISESNVKIILFRCRGELKTVLTKEGISI